MPWMTVAENLLLGKEPRGPLPLIRRRALAGRGRRDLRRASASSGSTRSSSSRRSRSPSARCSRSCGRCCASPRSSSSTSPPRRLPSRRSSGCSGSCARLRERGARASSSPRTAGARSSTSPTGSRSSATASTSPRARSDRRRRGGDADDRPHDRPHVSRAAAGRRRTRRWCSRCATCAATGVNGLLVRASPRRDPRHRRPRRPGPARPLHDPLRRAQGDRRRDPASTGEPRRIRRPSDAIRAGLGIALVPEDRKTEGLLLPMSVRDNLTLAILGRSHLRGVRRPPPTERGVVARIVERLQIRTRAPDRAGGGHALGRQPAEGADRPLAARRVATSCSSTTSPAASTSPRSTTSTS